MQILLIVIWITMTSDMYKGPLYPDQHGMLYDLAMMAAQEEYDAWVNSRKKRKGVKVYAVRTNKLEENADADI